MSSGKRFAIVLTESGIHGASQAAERLRTAVASLPCLWQPEEAQDAVSISVTASIGVAVFGIHGTTREELLQNADSAMYRAKHGGRNCVCMADITEDILTEASDQEGLITISTAHSLDAGENSTSNVAFATPN